MPLRRANKSTNIMGAASRFRATLYVVLENFRSKTGSFENLGPKQGPKTGFCDFLLKQGPKQGQNAKFRLEPGFQKQAKCGRWVILCVILC